MASSRAPAKKAAKGLSKTDVDKVDKLLDKSTDVEIDKNAKAAIPHVKKALEITAKVGHVDTAHSRVQERLLELYLDADKTAAKTLWAQLIDDWAEHDAGAQSWLTLAEAQTQLGTRIPADLRDRVRKAWARGRLANVLRPNIPGKPSDEIPESPEGAYWDATRHLLAGNAERAKACMAAASKDKNFANRCRHLEVMWLVHQGKTSEARAAFDKVLATATKAKQYSNWEGVAALSIVVGADDAKTHKQIVAAWKESPASSGASIYES